MVLSPSITGPRGLTDVSGNASNGRYNTFRYSQSLLTVTPSLPRDRVLVRASGTSPTAASGSQSPLARGTRT